jgi:hypothetical protein
MTSVKIDYKRIATKHQLSRGWMKIQSLVESRNLHGLYLYELHALSDYLCVTLSHKENMARLKTEEDGRLKSVPKISRYVTGKSPPKHVYNDPLLGYTRASTPDLNKLKREKTPKNTITASDMKKLVALEELEANMSEEKHTKGCHKCSGCPKDELVEHLASILYKSEPTEDQPTSAFSLPLNEIALARPETPPQQIDVPQKKGRSTVKIPEDEQQSTPEKKEDAFKTPKTTTRSNASTARKPREKSGAVIIKGGDGFNHRLQLSIDLPPEVSPATETTLKTIPHRTVHTMMNEEFNTPELEFEIRSFSPLVNIKHALVKRMGNVTEDDFDIYYNNIRITEDFTLETLGMNDQDKIEIVKRHV